MIAGSTTIENDLSHTLINGSLSNFRSDLRRSFFVTTGFASAAQ